MENLQDKLHSPTTPTTEEDPKISPSRVQFLQNFVYFQPELLFVSKHNTNYEKFGFHTPNVAHDVLCFEEETKVDATPLVESQQRENSEWRRFSKFSETRIPKQPTVHQIQRHPQNASHVAGPYIQKRYYHNLPAVNKHAQFTTPQQNFFAHTLRILLRK